MLRGPCIRFLNSLGIARVVNRSSYVASQHLGLPADTPQQLPASHLSTAAESHEHEVDIINQKFAEAREEIEFAREDAETVYFNESTAEARQAVQEVLGRWQSLLQKLPQEEQQRLQRSMGLKMEQLKAELKELDELHA
eukprot:GHRR01010978.1.p1 GENE.GHRR01010978.1~~GHRR01010978.1.p1  ORF type:complete len:139 (+),score=35.66 GHRR01010978.1:253-669(+)